MWWLVHAWVGQIVTFLETATLAAPWAPKRLPSPGGPLVRLKATLGRLGEPLRWSAGRSGVSPSHRRSTGHALPSAAAQEHVPAKGCHPACIQAVPRGISWLPVPSARARYELVLSPLSLASIVTLSGSHVFPGEIVAMSSLGSALAVAMVVAGSGDPTLAALRSTDLMRAPGWAPAHSDQWCISSRAVHALPSLAVSRHAGKWPACRERAN